MNKQEVVKWIKEDFERSKGYNKAFEEELNILTRVWMERLNITQEDLK